MKYILTNREISYFPTPIITALNNIQFEKGDKDKAIKLVNRMLIKLELQECSSEGYIDLSSGYLRQCIGGNYSRIIKKLLHLPILDTYIFSNGKTYKKNNCKKYRINPSLLIPEFGKIESSKKNKQRNILDRESLSRIQNDLSKLKIDIEPALKAMRVYANGISEKDLVLNNDITNRVINLGKSYMSKAKALSIANEKGLTLIKDGDKFFLDILSRYIENKKARIVLFHTMSIHKLDNKLINNPIRNITNYRLDTILTSLPSYLINFITLEEEHLTNIDLNNSQFTLLSYIIMILTKHTPTLLHSCCISEITKRIPDKIKELIESFRNELINAIDTKELDTFIKICGTGKFYDHIAEEKSISRAEAKIMAFEIMFSSQRNNSKNKKLFSDMFPTIIRYLDLFKKENHYKKLSIRLQKLESFIFIDLIYFKLLETQHTVFTKHDSILCKESESIHIKQIITDELMYLGIPHHLSVKTGYF